MLLLMLLKKTIIDSYDKGGDDDFDSGYRLV